jgi:hypothetical protein
MGSYYVDVSNDGKNHDNYKSLFLGHDSVCHQCQVGRIDDKDTKCTRKDAGCFVNGKCYDKGETDESDLCYRCDPSNSKTTLSIKPGVECQSWLFPVIAVGLAVLILLCIVIACVVLCRRRNSSKISKHEPAAVYEPDGGKRAGDKTHMVEVTFDTKGSEPAITNPTYTGN